MNCVEFIEQLTAEKTEENVKGYISWIILCVCKEILGLSDDNQKPVTHTSVNVEYVQDGDIEVSLIGGSLPPQGYSSAKVQMGGEYDANEALFSAGVLFYFLLTGRTLFEKYREVDGNPYFSDLDLCDDYDIKCARESFYDDKDTELKEFSKAVALLTSWDPSRRKDGVDLIVNAINDNLKSVVVIRSGTEKKTINISKFDNVCYIEELDKTVGYRPWLREFYVEMPCEETGNETEMPIYEDINLSLDTRVNESNYEIGVLVCEGKSSVPEVFCKAGSAEQNKMVLDVKWKVYDDAENSIPIYKRNANCEYAVSSYIFPECFQYIDVLELGSFSKCKTLDLRITFEESGEDVYSVSCESQGCDDIKIKKKIFIM